MPSEIREKPLPTPNPDHVHSPGSSSKGDGARPEGLEKSQEMDSDESFYDSCTDELDLMLTERISEPDPALGSHETDGARNRSSGQDVTVPPFLEENKNQPATVDVFDGVRSGSDEIVPAFAGWGVRIFSRLTRGRAAAHSRSPKTAHDDGADAPGLGTWMSLLLLSYASAVTIGLAWMLWTGRTFRSAAPTETGAPLRSVDQAAKSTAPSPREDLPAIPTENVTSVGKTIRIGDVEITPLTIQLAPIDLVHRINAAEFHREQANSLVLRFRMTNLSNVHTLKPLARSLVRDDVSALDRSFVASPDGPNIGLYSLAVESEWLIFGQEFPVLKPGESAETLVASEPINEDRLPWTMTWRLRLRIGPYRTDMLGVQFTKTELSR
jgi:hypothetical protein